MGPITPEAVIQALKRQVPGVQGLQESRCIPCCQHAVGRHALVQAHCVFALVFTSLHQHPSRPPASVCRAHAAEQHLQKQLAALQTRQAGLQAAASQTAAENLQLRQALHSAKQAAEPSVVQLRQLLLDPAVNREFAAMRADLEARTRELAIAQLELQALKFGPDPLMAKLDRQQVRALPPARSLAPA